MDLDMVGTSLNTLETFYFVVACFSTFLFVLKLILVSSVGMDDVETPDSEPASDSAFTFLSLQSVLAFLMGFGWIGLSYTRGGQTSSWKAFLIAGGIGLAFMVLSAFLMKMVNKLNHTPSVDLRRAVGQVGEAYVQLPSKGSGKIRLEIGGRLEIRAAMNEEDEPISAFEKVKVIKVVDGLFYVRKL